MGLKLRGGLGIELEPDKWATGDCGYTGLQWRQPYWGYDRVCYAANVFECRVHRC